jgi:SAM-dependent methyltransferase
MGFFVHSWKTNLMAARRSGYKEVLYKGFRPLSTLLNRRFVGPVALGGVRPRWVLRERGLPWATRRKWATQGRKLDGKTLMVQGTGNGWDAVDWAGHARPARIIGVDVYSFDSWPEVVQYTSSTLHVSMSFCQASLGALPMIFDASIDLCASDSVLEHVSNLDAVMRETWRVLRPGGVVYACYGPLWHCAGGDHFSGRGGLQNSFNHLLLSRSDYRRYVEDHLQSREDFQSGGRYIGLNLFSYLRTRDYLQAYRDIGFKIEELIIEISSVALRFKRYLPSRFALLSKVHPHCDGADFLIKTNLVRLRKPS